MNSTFSYFKNKTILVTGGAGSIGTVLVGALLTHEPKCIRILDINESNLFEAEQQFNSEKLRFFIGDIRDRERLSIAVEGVDIIFHTAALKHVPLCEYNPFEAVKTNLIGTQNLIEVARLNNVHKVITISTDKAVNPVSVMGATKLLAEKISVTANYYKGFRNTVFSCVRFGNVLNTKGSVIPLFLNQISKGGPVTVTDPEMTRFFISIPKAVRLVLMAASEAEGGEIFILKMPVVKIRDLASSMISLLSKNNITIEVIGKRSGEKNFEELLTENESFNAYENDEMIVVLPENKNFIGHHGYQYLSRLSFTKTMRKSYTTEDLDIVKLDEAELQSLLSEVLTHQNDLIQT